MTLNLKRSHIRLCSSNYNPIISQNFVRIGVENELIRIQLLLGNFHYLPLDLDLINQEIPLNHSDSFCPYLAQESIDPLEPFKGQERRPLQ